MNIGLILSAINILDKIWRWFRPPIVVTPKTFLCTGGDWDAIKPIIVYNRTDHPYFIVQILLLVHGEAEIAEMVWDNPKKNEQVVGRISFETDVIAFTGKKDNLAARVIQIAYLPVHGDIRLHIKTIRSGRVEVSLISYAKEPVSQHSQPGGYAISVKFPFEFVMEGTIVSLKKNT